MQHEDGQITLGATLLVRVHIFHGQLQLEGKLRLPDTAIQEARNWCSMAQVSGFFLIVC